MHKKHNLNIEQMRLNDTYRQLNSDHYSSVCYHENADTPSSYWTFLKLRIGFSILFLFFLIICFQAAPTHESKKVQSVFSHINQTDPYTKRVLNQFALNLSPNMK